MITLLVKHKCHHRNKEFTCKAQMGILTISYFTCKPQRGSSKINILFVRHKVNIKGLICKHTGNLSECKRFVCITQMQSNKIRTFACKTQINILKNNESYL